jgi:glycosyltransferase involved in cell wall biosynthesis
MILFDARALSSNSGGIYEYTKSILIEFEKLYNENDIIVLVKNSKLNTSKFRTVSLPIPTRLANILFFGIFGDLLLSLLRIKPSIYYSPECTYVKWHGVKSICTVHDLAGAYDSSYFSNKYVLRNAANACYYSSCVIAISKTTKNDIIKFFDVDESKIEVVYNGIHVPKIIDHANIYKKNIYGAKYMVSIGINPRKNVVMLINAFMMTDFYKKGGKLIFIGKRGWDDRYHVQFLKRISGQIIWLDFVKDSSKWPLILNSKGLISISHYEGFNIPAAEAILLSRPVLLSDIPIHRELYNKLTLLCNHDDVDDISFNIDKLLTCTIPLKLKMRYSWSSSAKSIYCIIDQL